MKDELMDVIIAFSNEFFPEESKEISVQQLLDSLEHYLERK